MYQIVPGKLSDETWNVLDAQKFVIKDGGTSDYAASPAFGYVLMSILADVCAGDEIRTITDRSDGYKAITRYFTEQSGGQLEPINLAETLDAEREVLVNKSLKIIGLENVDLKELIKLREREANETSKSTFLSTLRQNYFNEIDEYISRLRDVKKPGDITEIERQFESAMQGDIINLRKELRNETVNLILSKEFFGAVAIPLGIFAVPHFGASLNLLTGFASSSSVALLGKSLKDSRNKKHEKYTGHAMSWLYMLNPSKIIG